MPCGDAPGRPPRPAPPRAGLEVIERSTRSQSRLIEDLLDLSRIISGQVRLAVRSVDLAAVIGAALDSVRLGAEAKGIQLQSVLDSEAGPTDRFRQGRPLEQPRHGGLGLALVKHLVELHGETVRVESPGPDGDALFVLERPRMASVVGRGGS